MFGAQTQLSFYQNTGFELGSQKTENMSSHFYRRQILHRQLGISDSDFLGKHILEVGPGAGHNSLYFSMLNPRRLTLIEPSHSAYAVLQKLFTKNNISPDIVQIEEVEIEKFRVLEKYDLIICEGLIGTSGYLKPEILINSVLDCANTPASLMLTCSDYQAALSEMLRRLLGYEICVSNNNLDDKVSL
ncbi:MAG: class I SAM-dependent methyltransferase, partial [Myxococcaceae bacterium]